VTRVPDFDELVGPEVPAAERERLRGVHDLIVQAGPPPELSPEVESGPTLAMTLGREKRERHVKHRVALLAAAVALVAIVFLGGYIVGNSKTGGEAPARVNDAQSTSTVPAGASEQRNAARFTGSPMTPNCFLPAGPM